MLDWDEIDAAPALKSSEWIPRREALALGPVQASGEVCKVWETKSEPEMLNRSFWVRAPWHFDSHRIL
jgi:hypothetical protein